MKNYASKILLVLALTATIVSCKTKSPKLADGMWRGVFMLSSYEAPFLFEVSGANTESATVTLINGDERVVLKDVSYSGDTVIIPIRSYDAVLKAKMGKNTLEGEFIKLYSSTTLPFTAQKGDLPRFAESNEKPSVSLDGVWEIQTLGDNPAQQVGVFKQEESGRLTGSILATGGDFRFLEGVVQGNKFYLSAFAGLNPYLIHGEFTDADSFTAKFITSVGIKEFAGKRNPDAKLPDAYSLNTMAEGSDTISFNLPDLKGNMVSSADPKFQGKVLIVSILGSWCPNCIDEMAYLAPWYKENRDRGVEVVGIAFERKDDLAYAQQQLSHLIEQCGTEYDILFGGKSGKDAANAIEGLDKISAYPTTIFIDKKGKVRKIHTGFSGPATGKFYEEFKVEFNAIVDELVNEK